MENRELALKIMNNEQVTLAGAYLKPFAEAFLRSPEPLGDARTYEVNAVNAAIAEQRTTIADLRAQLAAAQQERDQFSADELRTARTLMSVRGELSYARLNAMQDRAEWQDHFRRQEARIAELEQASEARGQALSAAFKFAEDTEARLWLEYKTAPGENRGNPYVEGGADYAGEIARHIRSLATPAATPAAEQGDTAQASYCTRDYGHDGPCNGFPSPKCAEVAYVEREARRLFTATCVNPEFQSAPWEQQPESTKDHWRDAARSAEAKEPAA